MFGPTSAKARLRELIAWSGGYPRDLLRLLQNAIVEERIDDETLARLKGDVTDEYRLRIPAESFEWLARVAAEQDATPESDEPRRIVEGLILDNAVLRYANGAAAARAAISVTPAPRPDVSAA